MRPNFRPRRLRMAQLTIAVTALALPASAFAFAGTTAADSSNHGVLPIHVSPAQVQAGQAVTISGTTLRAQAGQRVTLQGRVGTASSWRTLQSTTVGPLGRFSFVAHLRRSSLVRVIAAQATRSQTRDVAVGRGGDLRPRQRRGQAGDGHRRAVGQPRRPRGAGRRPDRRSRPRASGRGRALVQLQGHAGTHWQTLATAHTARSGRFTLDYRRAVRDQPEAARPVRRRRRQRARQRLGGNGHRLSAGDRVVVLRRRAGDGLRVQRPLRRRQQDAAVRHQGAAQVRRPDRDGDRRRSRPLCLRPHLGSRPEHPRRAWLRRWRRHRLGQRR